MSERPSASPNARPAAGKILERLFFMSILLDCGATAVQKREFHAAPPPTLYWQDL